jgi:hypothetical protein
METGNADEFHASVIFIGGLIFAGTLLIVALSMLVIGLYRKTSKAKLTREIYEQTRRNGTNGTSNGRAH